MEDNNIQEISIDAFINEAKNGQTINQQLKDGRFMKMTVKAPNQTVCFELKRVLQDIITANPALVKAAEQGAEIEFKDPGIMMRLTELDSKCLVACVDQIDDHNVMAFIANLEDDAEVINRCKELCGIDVYTTSEGNE